MIDTIFIVLVVFLIICWFITNGKSFKKEVLGMKPKKGSKDE